MNIAGDNGRKDSARHRNTGVCRGTPATNGPMFVMVALIRKPVDKGTLSDDDVKSMLDPLEGTIRAAEANA